jgi:hypothetical protein
MRLLSIVILLVACSAAIAARVGAPNPQVEAATADAREFLRQKVLAARVTPDVSVSQLIAQVGGSGELAKALGSAQQLGGPRWLGDQTVQVRLSIDGGRIAKVLTQIVQAHPAQSPIPLDILPEELRSFSDRTFSATGTSTGAADVTRLRPPPENRAWAAVTDAGRRRALTSARDGAITQVLESLRPIHLDSGQTVGNALAESGAGARVKNWLATRPVKSISFTDDLVVRLELDASPDELWPVLKEALSAQKSVRTPATESAWDSLKERITSQASPAVGSGMVQPGLPPATGRGLAIPARPPAWATRQAEAQATSPAHGSKLLTARVAEAIALKKLSEQINSLQFTADITIAQAAQRDPRIEQAVSRAMRRARPFKVDYGGKGAVTVHVALNLAELWAEISGQP